MRANLRLVMRCLVLLFATFSVAAEQYNFNLNFKMGTRPAQATDEDIQFLQPQIETLSQCQEALKGVPVVIGGTPVLNKTWTQFCAQPFDANYVALFGDCDKQRAENRRWGPTTKQFINLLSSCEGERMELRRRLFASSRQTANDNHQQIARLIGAKEDEQRRVEARAEQQRQEELRAKEAKQRLDWLAETYKAIESEPRYRLFAKAQLYTCLVDGRAKPLSGGLIDFISHIRATQDEACCSIAPNGKSMTSVTLSNFAAQEYANRTPNFSIAEFAAKYRYYLVTQRQSDCIDFVRSQQN